ncbi:MAG: alanyl-tRNA editing protein [Anaerolineae bacterium]|nr:alanyl-tRNA editing protein [Anaerolineae bacterium]MDW8300504.1 alanyl-tRNA editing protein [Anaerolineae bacterium]
MTGLLYLLDSYTQTFDAVVTAVRADLHAVILNQTAFYPGGGGQPCDFGTLTINGVSRRVVKVQKVDGEVAHILESEAALPEVGTTVSGQLDWERRYRLMRTHTALHILSAVVFRDYGAQVTGGNMEPGEGRLDFEFETLQGDFVRQIEAALNAEVATARPISVRILPREEAFKIPDLIRTKTNLLPPEIAEVRVVTIEGLDVQADGGTHVRNTAEVGQIRVTDYKSKGKLNKRIYIAVD